MAAAVVIGFEDLIPLREHQVDVIITLLRSYLSPGVRRALHLRAVVLDKSDIIQRKQSKL